MGRPRKFDTQAVLAAARSEFQAKGYAATSCDDLMVATGLGKGSMYGAFGDKRQLFLSVLADYSSERLELVRQTLRAGGPAIEALRAMLRGEAVGGGGRGCLLVNSTCELAPHDEAVVAQARCTFGALEDAITETVERARDEGDVAADADARALARLLLAVLQGQEFLAKTGMAPSALRQIGETAAASLLGAPLSGGLGGPTACWPRAPAAGRALTWRGRGAAHSTVGTSTRPAASPLGVAGSDQATPPAARRTRVRRPHGFSSGGVAA